MKRTTISGGVWLAAVAALALVTTSNISGQGGAEAPAPGAQGPAGAGGEGRGGRQAGPPAPWNVGQPTQQQNAALQAAHPTLAIGADMPTFNLRGIDGKMHTPKDYAQFPILAVAFISNHCPASQNYEARLKKIQEDYAGRGLKVLAIAPNGPAAVSPRELNYADLDDSFESMILHAKHAKFNFPYIYDGETQSVSHAFGPKVTPHVFIFDKDRKLRFEGRIDDNQRGNAIKTHDTRAAIEDMLAGREVAVSHTAVFGCSTKWNSLAEQKKAEMNLWREQPVTLNNASLDDLKALRANPSGKDGKFLVVNFWNSKSALAKQQFPDILTSYIYYRSRSYDHVTVSTDASADSAAALKFLQEQHSAVKNYQASQADAQQAFGVTWKAGEPFTVMIAPDGQIVWQAEGKFDVLHMRRKVLGLMPDAGAFAGNREYWANLGLE